MNDWLPVAAGDAVPRRYEPTHRERSLAAFAHLSFLFSGGLAALVVWLAFRGSSDYVARHALRAAITQIGGMLAVTAIAGVTCGLGGVLAVPLVGFMLYEARNAWQGRWDAFTAD